MSSIPLDLKRRFERRWAARFAQQTQESACGKNQRERLGQPLGVLAKSKSKTRPAEQAGLRSSRA